MPKVFRVKTKWSVFFFVSLCSKNPPMPIGVSSRTRDLDLVGEFIKALYNCSLKHYITLVTKVYTHAYLYISTGSSPGHLHLVL